jgi:hypothetical protein
MKIKSFLYNQEPEETIKLAYAAVSSISKKLSIKLNSKADFEKRMTYGIATARRPSRWKPGQQVDIKKIRVKVSLSYHSPWGSTETESFSYDLDRELTDGNVSDVSAILPLIKFANRVMITITIDRIQRWRRQVKVKPTASLSSLEKS